MAATIVDRLDVLCWIVIAVLALAILERQKAPRTFFIDEWNFIFDRHRSGLSGWLAPHNGQLVLIPRTVYRIGFAVFGLDHYRPYRLFGLLVHALVATLVYRYVRARQGKAAGVAVGALFILLGAGWEVIYQPFSMNFTMSAAAGIVSWLALDRRSARGDLIAMLAAMVALACGGLATAMVLGTAVRLFAERDHRRLLRVIALPAMLYATWFVSFGESQGGLSNTGRLPRYVFEEAASSIAGLGGRPITWGRVALVAVAIAIVATVWKRGGIRPAVLAPATALIANWLLVGYSRGHLGEPASSRYVYGGALLIILMTSDLVQLPARAEARLAVLLVGAFSIWGNWWVLHAGPVDMRRATTYARAELRAIEWSANSVAPTYTPDPYNLTNVNAGEYLEAVAELGSAAAAEGEIELLGEEFRREVDRVTLQANEFAAGSVVDAMPCSTKSAIGEQDGSFVVQLSVTGGRTLVVHSAADHVEVRAKRYAGDYRTVADVLVPAASAATVTLPIDSAPRQEWTVELRSRSRFELCDQNS